MLTEPQKKERLLKITSSVVAGCLELCPFTSPLQAWRAILGDMVFEGNKATERGTELEPSVLAWGVKQLGKAYAEAAFIDGNWRGDNADGILFDKPGEAIVKAVIEAKTVSQGMAKDWGADATGEVPHYVRAQCMWHLLHWPTARMCFVPVLFGGFSFEYRLYHVDRDDNQINVLERMMRVWWETHIGGNVAPDANHLDQAELRAMFPVGDSKVMPDNDDVALHAIEYCKARTRVKDAQKEKDFRANRLRQLLGTNSYCEGPWGSVSNHQNTKKVRVLKVIEKD